MRAGAVASAAVSRTCLRLDRGISEAQLKRMKALVEEKLEPHPEKEELLEFLSATRAGLEKRGEEEESRPSGAAEAESGDEERGGPAGEATPDGGAGGGAGETRALRR